MLEILVLLVSIIVTISGLATYIDSLIPASKQERLSSYLKGGIKENSGTIASTFSECLAIVVGAFISERGAFKTSSAIIAYVVLFLGTTACSIMLLAKQETSALSVVIPTEFTFRVLGPSYVFVASVALFAGILSIYQSVLFFRIFTTITGFTKRALIIYSDIVLSYSICLLFILVSVFGSSVISNEIVKDEVNLIIMERQIDGSSIFRDFYLHDDGSTRGYGFSNSSFLTDQSIDDFETYLSEIRPSFNLQRTRCTQEQLNTLGTPTNFSTSPPIRRICYRLSILEPMGDFSIGELSLGSLFGGLPVFAQSSIAGIFNIVGIAPLEIGANVNLERPSEDALARNASALIRNVFQINQTREQTMVWLSNFMLPAIFFTFLIYSLAIAIFSIRQLSRMKVFLKRGVLLVNGDRPILSISVYINLFAALLVIALYYIGLI